MAHEHRSSGILVPHTAAESTEYSAGDATEDDACPTHAPNPVDPPTASLSGALQDWEHADPLWSTFEFEEAGVEIEDKPASSTPAEIEDWPAYDPPDLFSSQFYAQFGQQPASRPVSEDRDGSSS